MRPKVFILRSDTQAAALATFLRLNRQACANAGKPLQVIVMQHGDKRHSAQNALMWVLLGQIAEQAMIDGRQYSAVCWHDYFKGQLLGFVDLPGGGKMPISTASLTVQEFAEYVTRLQATAAQSLGVVFEDRA